MEATDALWSIKRLSQYLGVPVDSIYKWRVRGEGPRGFRVGRHVRFRPEDVERWLEAQADEPRPAA